LQDARIARGRETVDAVIALMSVIRGLSTALPTPRPMPRKDATYSATKPEPPLPRALLRILSSSGKPPAPSMN
jgi:hypothetical protein